MWESDEDLWNSGNMYSLAISLDPLTHHNLGPGDPYKLNIQIGRSLRMQATRNEFNQDPETFIKKSRELANFPINSVFILEKHGDLVYFPSGGIIPRRNEGVIHGVYPKIGWNQANKWQGRIPLEEMPYLINPKSGFIISCNNHMSSHNVKDGITQAFTFPGRKTRLNELIEEAIARTGGKLTVRDMQTMTTDVFDVQARESLPDMLYCVEKAKIKLNEAQEARIAIAKKLLSTWDFQFTSDSAAASIFAAWEFHLAYYLHETKIESPVVRVSVSYVAPVNQFTWLSIQ